MTKGRSLLSILAALVAVAPLGLMAVSPAAVAQQPAQVAFSTYELFAGPDSVDLDPGALARLADAIRGAGVPDGCPVGKLRIRVAEGDPLFQEALLAARRDAALAALDRLVPVAGRLLVETAIFGGNEGHDAVYDFPRDTAAPALRANSMPRKGSKVQPGRRIVVRIAARDDAGPWETGVKTIQLVADSEAGRFIASENYEPCSDPKEKRVQATYEVPADPPPVVRLTALAEDHSGHLVEESAEFPTGDWYGTITSTAKGNIYNDTAEIDFSFSVAADGAISANGHARMRSHPQPGPDCVYTRTITPGEFDVEIEVERDFLGNEFKITPSRAGGATYVHHYTGVCNGLGTRTDEQGYAQPYNALAGHRITGGISVLARDGANNEASHREADWAWTDAVVSHRARQ
jgi:hypothetical protein